MRHFFLAVGFVILCCSISEAQIVCMFDQKFDAPSIRWDLQKREDVKHAQEQFSAIIQKYISPLKEDEIKSIYGPTLPALPDDASLPIFSYNGVAVSGIAFEDPAKSKNHTEFYRIGDLGYLQVFYQIDGVSVGGAGFYFKTDQKFTPLKTSEDISRRLGWDETRLQAILRWINEHHPENNKS